MYIKDLESGTVRKYGTNQHDALAISPDGKYLYYENLQNGDSSRRGYRFVIDEEGRIPQEDEVLVRHGADAYADIGGRKEEEVHIMAKLEALTDANKNMVNDFIDFLLKKQMISRGDAPNSANNAT